MTAQSRIALALVVMLIMVLINGPSAQAAMFCNMDRVGGSRAVPLQQASSRAAAAALEAVAITVRILAQLELHLSGDQQALPRARLLVNEAIRALNNAINLLRGIRVDASVASAINAALRNVQRDLAPVLALANVDANDAAVRTLQSRLQEGAQTLLGFCAEELDRLQQESTPMGQVYREVASSRVPQHEVLLAAIRQLSETLKVGRLISAAFLVAGR